MSDKHDITLLRLLDSLYGIKCGAYGDLTGCVSLHVAGMCGRFSIDLFQLGMVIPPGKDTARTIARCIYARLGKDWIGIK